eukprot:CAMPEP_0114143436 /NCGR_PEP_ID=MMETSP0043_2-20121206/18986_1 /TAXON_ID=464988 /ORGANISM="Hemiselmis andersenii, Strain CCMP644" /LENGTH=256 /DNA_ID=CAMNT_0001237735 /DNA_START=221 /DNA_END=987 /DNA_ORIENTATION=-
MVKYHASQWVIDPKVFQKTTYHTEYQDRVGDKAPDFVYKRMRNPPKNKSVGLQGGAKPYPTELGFKTTNMTDFVPEKSTLAPGYVKREPFQVKAVQVKLGTEDGMAFKQPVSHKHYDELDMRQSNVRGLRTDGLVKAGMRMTHIAPYNIVPGVGPEGAGSRYVFDAYQDSTNKFRDTRRFAKINNPDIPRGHSLNLLTGEVARHRAPPTADLNPRGSDRPPLFSLAQVRPPSPSRSTALRVTQGVRMGMSAAQKGG